MKRGEHEKARAWREAQGWSQFLLAALLGVSRSTVVNMERGHYGDPERPIGDRDWQRYKLMCRGLGAGAIDEWSWGER